MTWDFCGYFWKADFISVTRARCRVTGQQVGYVSALTATVLAGIMVLNLARGPRRPCGPLCRPGVQPDRCAEEYLVVSVLA